MSNEQTLAALKAHIAETGYPPSIRELGKRLGLSSPDSVRERLLALVDAGLIQRGTGARQIRILEVSEEPSRVSDGEVHDNGDKAGGGSSGNNRKGSK